MMNDDSSTIILDGKPQSTIDGVFSSSVQVVWQPLTPDLTHCRSLWLNSLEIRVNQRDSSLISIANDLSQVIGCNGFYIYISCYLRLNKFVRERK